MLEDDNGVSSLPEPDEIPKLSCFYQLLRAMISLIQVVRTDYGWVSDNEAATLYLALRDELVFLGEAILDDELPYLTPSVSCGLPDELYSLQRWSRACLEDNPQMPVRDWFDDSESAISELEELANDTFGRIGKQIVELPVSSSKLVSDLNRAIPRLSKQRERLLKDWTSQIEMVTESEALGMLTDGLTFDFVSDADLKGAVSSYVKEAIGTYQSGYFRSSVIQVRACMEGLLVWALRLTDTDSKIEYSRRYPNDPRNEHIDKWDFPALIGIAKKSHLFLTPDLDRNCMKVNSLRNVLHPSKFSSVGEIDVREAVFGIIALGWLVEDVRNYAEKVAK